MSKKTFCDICHKEMDDSESNFNITIVEHLDWEPKIKAEKKALDDVCQRCYSKVYSYIDELKRNRSKSV